MLRRYGWVLVMLSLCSCASIIDGSEQRITVNTNPMGADCLLNRRSTKDGPETTIARVNPTPGDANIEKTKYDITIVCNKSGYQTATYINHSGNQGSTLGNIILGGGVGWAVDSARGADNKYDSPINIMMAPLQAASYDPYAAPSYAAPAAVMPPASVPVPAYAPQPAAPAPSQYVPR